MGNAGGSQRRRGLRRQSFKQASSSMGCTFSTSFSLPQNRRFPEEWGPFAGANDSGYKQHRTGGRGYFRSLAPPSLRLAYHGPPKKPPLSVDEVLATVVPKLFRLRQMVSFSVFVWPRYRVEGSAGDTATSIIVTCELSGSRTHD
jgi:hypothetical protein